MSSINIGKIFGIPIKIDFSWFFVFLLVGFGLMSQKVGKFPDVSPAFLVLTATLTTILLFLSVLLHELGHSLVALRKGIKVESIRLFIFGGVATMTSEPKRAKDEFYIAAAGPLVSFLLAFTFATVSVLLGGTLNPISFGFALLAGSNFVLAAFNLIPAFPLDGGRILRAFLWHYKKSYFKATLISSEIGKTFGYVGILYAVYVALTAGFFSGLWIGFISWYILQLAKSTQAHLYHSTLASEKSIGWQDFPNVNIAGGNLTINQSPNGFIKLYGPVVKDSKVGFVVVQQPWMLRNTLQTSSS